MKSEFDVIYEALEMCLRELMSVPSDPSLREKKWTNERKRLLLEHGWDHDEFYAVIDKKRNAKWHSNKQNEVFSSHFGKSSFKKKEKDTKQKDHIENGVLDVPDEN